MTQKEFDKIIYNHNQWLLMNKSGERADFSGKKIEDMEFKCVNLDFAVFENAILKNIIIKGSNLNNIHFHNTYLKNVNFEECNIIESDFDKAFIKDSEFKNSNISKSNFNQSSIFDIDFRNCILLETSFTDSRLDDVKFIGDIFYNNYLNESHLDRVTFENSNTSKNMIEDEDNISKLYIHECISGINFHGATINKSNINILKIQGYKHNITVYDNGNLRIDNYVINFENGLIKNKEYFYAHFCLTNLEIKEFDEYIELISLWLKRNCIQNKTQKEG